MASSHRSHRATRRRATRRTRWGSRTPAHHVLGRALVVVALVGGVTAFVHHDKEVRISVDGHTRTLHTFAGDVRTLLAQQGLRPGPHDAVRPTPDTRLHHGDAVTVALGRRLRLTLDGQPHPVWTTATTVRTALAHLGVRTAGAHLSRPAATPITRHGLTLDVRTERTITVLLDGRRLRLRTNTATVRAALDQAGVTLRGQDAISVPPLSFPRDGQTIAVTRIHGAAMTREEPVPFRVVRHRDPDLFVGTEVVVVRGEEGLSRVTYTQRTVDGVRQRPVRVAEQVLRRPVTQVVRVGARPLPTSVASADALNWAALAACESQGRPDEVDPSGTYGGLYQFDVHTWRQLGGTGHPQDAPTREQTERAKRLYVRQGTAYWPVCGRRLFT